MSTIRIKDLPEKVDKLNDKDLLVIEDSEDTKKIPLVKMKSAFSMDGILNSMKNLLLGKITSFTSYHDDRYNELNDKTNELETTCDNIENEIDISMVKIEELIQKYAEQVEIIKTLTSENDRLTTLITQLEKERDNLSAEIVKLYNQLNANNTSIIELETKIYVLNKNYQELKVINRNLHEILLTIEDESKAKIEAKFNETNDEIADKLEEIMQYIKYYHPDVDNIDNEV